MNMYISVHLCRFMHIYRASLMAQRLKHLPAVRETWVLFLGSEDHLEKGKDTQYFSTPVFCPGEFHRLYSPWGRKELDKT